MWLALDGGFGWPGDSWLPSTENQAASMLGDAGKAMMQVKEETLCQQLARIYMALVGAFQKWPKEVL